MVGEVSEGLPQERQISSPFEIGAKIGQNFMCQSL